jgi:hypothetical protein
MLPAREQRAGHLLMATRIANFRSNGICALPLGVWTPGESARVLMKRLAVKLSEAVQSIAETLGHLPLALEQVAAYLLYTQQVRRIDVYARAQSESAHHPQTSAG